MTDHSDLIAAGVVPMSEHVERFWRYLETETVRVLVDKRREMGNGCVYHDSSSFPDDVAKALVADRKAQSLSLSEARERFARSTDYSVDLQRIIEDLCSGGPIRQPQTSARHHYDMAAARIDEMTALQSRLDVAEQALKPFAKAADVWENNTDDASLWVRPLHLVELIKAGLTVGHLRHAQSALENSKARLADAPSKSPDPSLSSLRKGAEVVEPEDDFLAWAYDTLREINVSNYDHDDVCRLNDASVEVILAIAARRVALVSGSREDG